MSILDPNLYTMTRTAWALVFTCAGMLALGLYVLHREAYSRAGRSFFLLMPPAIVWFGAFAVMASCADPDAALVWSRVAYIGVPFIPAVITQFAVTLVGVRRPRLLPALWIVSALFVFGFLSSNGFISGIQRFSWGFYPKYGPGGVAFVLYFAMTLGYDLSLFWTGLHEATAVRPKARYRAFLAAFSLTFLGAVDFLPKFGFDVYPFGFAAIFLGLAVMAWANWRYRLVDITPAFAAEEILHTLQSAVIVTDFYGVVRVMNGAAAALLRRRPDSVIGHTLATSGIDVLPRDGGDHRPTVPYRGFAAAIKDKDGRNVEVDMSATWLRDAAGARIGIVYAATDVSEKLREASELARSTAEKEQLELFASIAAHDLRKPLNHIGSFADLTATAISDGQHVAAQEYLSRIRSAAKRVQAMIDGLLRYERAVLTGGDEEVVNLGALIADIRLNSVGIEQDEEWLTVDPLPLVRCAPIQFRQLFENLISNAVKYRHPDRPLHVQISADLGPTTLCLTVRDNGIGFRKEDQENVFTPFSRLDSAARQEGHGLGLAICRRIVTKHGGRIEAASEPGNGTRFSILLPAERGIRTRGATPRPHT